MLRNGANSRHGDDERQQWLLSLIELGVPKTIATQLVSGPIDLRWGKRVAAAFMLMMFAVLAVWVLVISQILNGCCGDGAPLNSFVSLCLALPGSFCLLGVLNVYVVKRLPLSIRKSMIIEGFLDPRQEAVVSMLTAGINEEVGRFSTFEDFERVMERNQMKFWKWPTLVLVTASVASYFLMPAICV